jgi:rhodanese-related sulfurtransferase
MKFSIRITALVFIGLVFSLSAFGQKSLSKLLKKHNKKNVPNISVERLATPKTNVVLLDTREPKEYEVSHLKDAIYLGFNNFNIETVTHKISDKSTPIVVYCSLGIRSELVAHQLIKAGYTNIQNLYGGIFEWKNKGFQVYNTKQKATDSVHTYSKQWSKWLIEGIKIYPEKKN